MTASDKLRAYLRRAATTQRRFAVACGLDETAISRYLSGETTPSLAAAAAIERATRKAVRAAEWVE